MQQYTLSKALIDKQELIDPDFRDCPGCAFKLPSSVVICWNCGAYQRKASK